MSKPRTVKLKYAVTQYWSDHWFSFDDATALLRQTMTKRGMGQRLMSAGTQGGWIDARRITLGDLIFNWSKVTTSQAARIAACLGGSLLE
jgi:hypothetical protein